MADSLVGNLKEYLLLHEIKICLGIEGFGKYQPLFVAALGHYPRADPNGEAEAFVDKVKWWVIEILKMRSAHKIQPKAIVEVEFSGELPEPKDEFRRSVEGLAKCKLVARG